MPERTGQGLPGVRVPCNEGERRSARTLANEEIPSTMASVPPNPIPKATASLNPEWARDVCFTTRYVIPLSRNPVRRPRYNDIITTTVKTGKSASNADWIGWVIVRSMASLIPIAIAQRMPPIKKYLRPVRYFRCQYTIAPAPTAIMPMPESRLNPLMGIVSSGGVVSDDSFILFLMNYTETSSGHPERYRYIPWI